MTTLTTLTMSWAEWAAHDAVALAARLRAGEVSAAELAQQARAAIERVNPDICAVVETFDDVVENPLKDGMNPTGPFAGIPFLIKDLGPTLAGRLQECGSFFMRGQRAQTDTYLVTRMRAAGLNLMGRTTTPEFGVCGSAANPAYYVTRNPWNPAHTAGGSSSGAGAALAAGVLPLAHGSDGGGSIRIPAAFTGNLGLKPSRGVFSIAPMLCDISGYVSTQGCLSRSVRDTAAFFDACRGGAPGEFMPYWQPAEPYRTLIERDPKPLRIAVSHEWGDYRTTPHIVAELERAARLLESLGHHVEWRLPTVDLRAAYAAQTTCYVTNFAQLVDGLIRARGLDSPPADLFEPVTRRIWEAGRHASYAERYQMQQTFNTVTRALGEFLEEWDIILTPTTALPTPLVDDPQFLTISDEPDVYAWFHNLWRSVVYTPLANLTGTPAITMPIAQQENGMPLGIQAQSRQGNDGLLLQLAAQVERALGGQWNGGRVAGIHVTR